MDTRQKIYVTAIGNEDSVHAKTAVCILWDRKKYARSSCLNITLSQRHPSALTSLEGHQAFLGQFHPIMESNIQHHKFSPAPPL